MGGGIRGGLYGDWPGLAPGEIDRNGLRVTVDYRYVLADILEHRLGSPAMAQVLPGFLIDDARRLNLADPLPPLDEPETQAEPEAEATEAIELVSAPAVSGATYRWVSDNGGEIRVELPAPADDSTLVEIETLRSTLGEATVSYAVAVLDNSSGSEPLLAPVFTATGGESALTYREAWVIVDLWRRSITDVALADQAAMLVNRLQSAAVAAPGAVGTVLLVAPGVLATVTEVRLATPAGDVVLEPVEIDLSDLVDATP
jgi:hypothetical protein